MFGEDEHAKIIAASSCCSYPSCFTTAPKPRGRLKTYFTLEVVIICALIVTALYNLQAPLLWSREGPADERPPATAKRAAKEKLYYADKRSVLRDYGYKDCPWMSLLPDVRYPRVTSHLPPPPGMLRCVEQLVAWQQAGDIVFKMMEGQGLGAQMGGGFHGNNDDGDLDLTMYSRKGVDMNAHYDWCKPWGPNLGSYGFYAYSPTLPPGAPGFQKANKAAFLAQSKGTGAITEGCIGTWEGIEVLLPDPIWYFRTLYGGSYWVPPVQGGKDMGSRLWEYMKPSLSLFPYHGDWLVHFHEGLKRGVDMDSDGKISSAEFMRYVRNSTRVNQKWLALAIENDPCMVANGIVHYQHTYVACNVSRVMRSACSGKNKTNKLRCDEENFKVFDKTVWKGGPRYLHNKTKCTKKIEAP